MVIINIRLYIWLRLTQSNIITRIIIDSLLIVIIMNNHKKYLLIFEILNNIILKCVSCVTNFFMFHCSIQQCNYFS